VGVLSAAIGPVVGGALTQAFSWRAIFVAQAPLPIVAALLHRTWAVADQSEEPRPPLLARPLAVLGLLWGALSALLFGLVLLLVVGWAMRPLAAALSVSVVPVAALAGSYVRGDAWSRVLAGCALVGGGVAALAFLPSNDVVWLIVPECVAGVGMGLALTPLLEHIVPERAQSTRATNTAVRHLGIT